MMTANEIKQIIEQNKDNIAFVIGNGINRHNNSSNPLSWEHLLMSLWQRMEFPPISEIPKGISLTEFYDVLELENTNKIDIQNEIANSMFKWEPLDYHKNIVKKIKEFNAPILTTNFEGTFAKAFNLMPLKIDNQGFTDYYPWSVYHGESLLKSPTDGFGIWHINGMINYKRSIRLGLTHYMGSVERARKLIYKSNKHSLFSKENFSNWDGCKTWLHIIFNKPLFIFGLGLEENEIFLRWLLIERMKYFKQFPTRECKGWYVSNSKNSKTEDGKRFFLEKIGFEIIEVDDYADLYENIWK